MLITLCQLCTIFLTDGTRIIKFWILSQTFNCSVSWQLTSRLPHWDKLQKIKIHLIKGPVHVCLAEVTQSTALRALCCEATSTWLKRIWIIDGENDTSVARGNERPTLSSLLPLLWLTESANKDDTWQLTRPITGRANVQIHRERRREENDRKSKIERKQKRASLFMAFNLWLTKQLVSLSCQ